MILLNSLAQQTLAPREIIIVDNDPAGGADKIVQIARKFHPNLSIRYAIEPRKGISFARNTAASLARGDFIAWIDDDETASENWLLSLYAAQAASDADGVFGPVIPIFPQGSRSWPKRSGVFERPRHLTGTQIDVREARSGNALVKTGLLRTDVSPFDIGFANTGGEDSDFFVRMESRGARFEWCDEAEVFELVPLDRQRLGWVLERRLRAAMHFWRRHPASRFRHAIRASVGGAMFVVFGIAGIIVAPLGLHRSIRLWLYAAGGLGRIFALTGVRWDAY